MSSAADEGVVSTRTLSVQVLRVIKQRSSASSEGAALVDAEIVSEVLREHATSSTKQERVQLGQRIRDIIHVLVASGLLSRRSSTGDDQQLVPFPNHPLLANPASPTAASPPTADSVAAKKTLLANLLQQHILLHELAKRNQQQEGEDASTSSKLALPFLVVQSAASSKCELTISENRCKVTAAFQAATAATPGGGGAGEDAGSFDVTDDISVLLGLGLLDQVSESTIRELVPEPLLELLPDVLKSKLTSTSSSSSSTAPEQQQQQPKKLKLDAAAD